METKFKHTVYKVSLCDLPNEIFFVKCKYRDENDLNSKVTKKLGLGVTYKFEVDCDTDD